MRILRPQTEPSPRPNAPAAPEAAGAGGALLRCRLRLATGRTFTSALPAARHRALQLGMLHVDTAELVELTPGVRRPGGSLELGQRRRAEHYLPGGACGDRAWLEALLEHADRILAGRYTARDLRGSVREEAFVGVAPRARARGNKDAVAATRFLWVDVDEPARLPALWAFLAERPCHLLIESGGSGGAHAYWKLDQPLTVAHPDEAAGELGDPIERANLRIIHRLGVGDDGQPNVADTACFPAGTLILTERGLVPIEAVAVGERVLTHRGRWRAVTAVMRRRDDTIRVVGQGHPGLETTAGHPFHARRRYQRWVGGPYELEQPRWRPARDLVGELWATPTNVEPIAVPPVGGRGMEFTTDFWWLVGRWLGDGHVQLKAEPTRNRSGAIHLSCGDHELVELRARLAGMEPVGDIAGRGELRWNQRRKRTEHELTTCHDGHARWLVTHFGRRAGGKTVPAWALGMPAAHREALLDGYLSADGSAIGNERKATTVSHRLAVGIRLLAESLGHRVGLHRYPQPTDTIEGRAVNVRDQWLVRWKHQPVPRFAYADGDHGWSRVRELRHGQQDVEVFNLSVEDDESYVAEGIVVHNCKERARVMRLAGTINHKTGRYARIIEADFQLPGYPLEELIGDLPDPAPPAPPATPARPRRAIEHNDPYKRIPPPQYFERLAGITVPRGGLVSCPAPWHDDLHPSCSVGVDSSQGWRCHAASCGARGAIYDLASVRLGGPWGRDLRGDAFKRAHELVVDVFGDLT